MRRVADGGYLDGDGVAHTLSTGTDPTTHVVVQSVSENERAEVVLGDVMRSLTSGGGKPGQGYPCVMTIPEFAVRRLMPVECERLQGWPDEHTAKGVLESGSVKTMSDSTRYRMAGNGVASPCAAWVGRQIDGVYASTAMPQTHNDEDDMPW